MSETLDTEVRQPVDISDRKVRGAVAKIYVKPYVEGLFPNILKLIRECEENNFAEEQLNFQVGTLTDRETNEQMYTIETRYEVKEGLFNAEDYNAWKESVVNRVPVWKEHVFASTDSDVEFDIKINFIKTGMGIYKSDCWV